MSSSTMEPRTSWRAGRPAGSWRAMLTKPIRRWIAAIDCRRRRRRDIDALMAFDDHMLRDIGLGRSEIECAMRHGRPFDRGDDRLLP